MISNDTIVRLVSMWSRFSKNSSFPTERLILLQHFSLCMHSLYKQYSEELANAVPKRKLTIRRKQCTWN